jgi:hypothetical protein
MSEQNYRRQEFANKAKGFDGPTQLPRDDDECTRKSRRSLVAGLILR